jgi:predicted small metal-binding protein
MAQMGDSSDMKSFACGDVVPGCDARWTVESEDELLAGVRDHAAAVHGLADLPPAVVAAVHARTTTA